ncbi:MAG: lysylphosphatidylglycerol synthase domain-containing protein [Phycisphaerales bacterium]
MNESQSITPNGDERVGLNPTRVAIQIIGFAVGIALLAWCVIQALRSGDFERLRYAPPGLIAALMGCTAVTVVVNGTIFWMLIRPVVRLDFWHIQALNGVVNLLNYAPIRLGMLTRIAHHRKVDRVPLFHLIAWYGAIGVLTLVTLAALLLATLLRPAVDWIWGMLLLVILACAAAAVVWVARHHLMTARLRGAERMLDHPLQVWACVGLRLVDMTAYAGRLYVAFAILGIELELQEIVYLSIVSMIASLSPAGSLGIREWVVAMLAPMLAGGAGTDDAALDALRWQAVLIDRAGEAIVFVPMGIVCVVWMVHTWRRTSRADLERPVEAMTAE